VTGDAEGNVFGSDGGRLFFQTGTANNRIEEFTNTGVFITTIGGFGPNNGQFSFPFGLAVDRSGNLFVVDSLNSPVQEFATCGPGDDGCGE
jgi:DNA-binding beta-propeller fold protein YncE